MTDSNVELLPLKLRSCSKLSGNAPPPKTVHSVFSWAHWHTAEHSISMFSPTDTTCDSPGGSNSIPSVAKHEIHNQTINNYI